jgi:transposase
MSNWCDESPIKYATTSIKRSQVDIKSENLGNRFILKKHLVLGFMYDFNIEFTNNLAEQDIRMCKVKSKISGSFRSAQGSSNFVKIRSYISTIRKNKHNVLDALYSVFDNTPLLPFGC